MAHQAHQDNQDPQDHPANEEATDQQEAMAQQDPEDKMVLMV